MRSLYFTVITIFLSLGLFAQSREELVKEINKTIEKIANSEDSEDKLKRILEFSKVQEKAAGGIAKQIALCNYLIEQACILEALDGRGVGLVRKELTQNINDHGLTQENKRYLRRLIELCEEAERSYSNVNYVEVDGSQAKADLLVSNIGVGVGVSLALGDITPLISSAVKIGRGYSNINKTKSRQLQTLIQSHKARITNFLFTVNSFKNDLIAEKGVQRNQVITPDAYRNFLKVLMIEDYNKRVKNLNELNKAFPDFRAVKYYLAEDYLKNGENNKALDLFKIIIEKRNPLVHKDGFVGQSYTSLAGIYLKKGEYSESLAYCNSALKENPYNGIALNYKAENYIAMKKYEEAYKSASEAVKANPESAEFAWQLCKVASLHKEDQVGLHLRSALEKGFRDFESVRNWPGMKDNLKDPEIKYLLTPELSAFYKPGIFKDDVILTNIGLTALDDVNYKVEVRYLKKDKWEQINLEGKEEFVDKGAKIELKNKFSMPKDSKCTIKATFTSAQNPLGKEVIYYYNFLGAKESLAEWEYELKKAIPEVMKTNDKSALEELKKKIKDFSDRTFDRNPQILELMAELENKLGNKDKAIELLEKAKSKLKETVSEKDYKSLVQPFIDKLKELRK